MPCDCCAGGRCCKGSTCTSGTKSKCATDGGTFTPGETCDTIACIDLLGINPCDTQNPCACEAVGKTVTTASSCDCRQVKAAGYSSGGCQTYYCQVCDTSTGSCVSNCPSTRDCCAGTCCPDTQKCQGTTCVDKCAAGTKYCKGTNRAYACCSAGEKCCGADGCKPTSSRSVTVTVNIPGGFVNTGLTLNGNEPWGWHATGTASSSLGYPNSNPDGIAGTSGPRGCNYLSLIGTTNIGALPAGVICMSRDGSEPASAGRSGLLYLSADFDSGQDFGGGSYTVTIYAGTDPCPGYNPSSVDITSFGPGQATKQILGLFGIVSSPTCSCNARAAQMDEWGIWGCVKRFPTIVGWLGEEARKREMWFFWLAGAGLLCAAFAWAALRKLRKANNH